ncbi:MAG: leucine-rich repeat domain-containing protein [Parasporobacterium sp.]|nr:leucine-rich repeat domain-containing protein [Parasporobacterium sp.]
MNKIVKYLCTLLSVVLLVPAVSFMTFADDEPDLPPEEIYESSDYTYWINQDETITIAEYLGEDLTVEIPSEIDGYPVSAIGEQAFSYKKMESLLIPEEVRTIASRAFEYCTVTESLILPAGVSLDYNAFGYAKLPVTVTIPEDAVLGEGSFAYCDNLEFLIVEENVSIEEQAFSYSKKLRALVCASGSSLGDRAFDSCKSLEQAILCGDVETTEDPFSGSDLEIHYAEADAFAQLAQALPDTPARQTTEKTDTSETLVYTIGGLTFTIPRVMEKTSMIGYDLALLDNDNLILVCAASFPPATLDFEDEESVQIMADRAEDYVGVEAAYQVRICGYPSIWMDIYDPESDSNGTYLYISTEETLYHLMFLNALDTSRDDFVNIAETIVIDGQSEGTDLSPLSAVQ